MSELAVTNAPDQQRFEIRVDGALAGFAAYKRQAAHLVFTHTEVDAAYEGKGVGSALAKGALDAARAAGDRIVPQCSFIASYVKRHPEYAELVVEPTT